MLSPRGWSSNMSPSTGHEMFCCLFQPRDKVIRSQFACTYKDEEVPLNRVLDFPSTSQVPSCMHPAPKQKPILDVVDGISSDMEETTTGAGSVTLFKHRRYFMSCIYKRSTQFVLRSLRCDVSFLWCFTAGLRSWHTFLPGLKPFVFPTLGLVLTISH